MLTTAPPPPPQSGPLGRGLARACGLQKPSSSTPVTPRYQEAREWGIQAGFLEEAILEAGPDSRVGAHHDNRWKRLRTKEQRKVVTIEMLSPRSSYPGPAGPETPPKLSCLILLTLRGKDEGGFEVLLQMSGSGHGAFV